MDLRWHTHKAALDTILHSMRSLLAQNPAHKICILKVKAHTGDIGNEIADLGAKWAAKYPDRCDLTMPADSDPTYKRLYWPHAMETPLDGKELRPRGLTDLSKDLYAHMHHRNRFGTSNKFSFYFRAWQKARNLLDGKASNAFLYHPAVTFQEQKTALNYRYGTLWSNNMAKKHGLRTCNTCPICPREDGIGHIAGGCTHPTMERMYTERHNAIGRILLRAIAKGNFGEYIRATDLGSEGKSNADGAPHIPFNSLPTNLQTILDCPTTTEDTRTRPDIILITPPKPGSDKPTLLLVELKTCRCTHHNYQLLHCQQQHQQLIERLAHQYNVKLIPILIGHSGTIYTDHTLEGMKQLGIDDDKVSKCASKMHIATIKQLHSIVMTRRHLEHKTQQQAGDRTKNINTTHAIHGPSHQADKRVKHRHNYTSNPP
jgi:hypothetical protein